MSLNLCYVFWLNTVNLYSKLGVFRFISVFGDGHQSLLTRDGKPSCIAALLTKKPRNRISTPYQPCASLSQAWREKKLINPGEEVFPQLEEDSWIAPVKKPCWSPGQTKSVCTDIQYSIVFTISLIYVVYPHLLFLISYLSMFIYVYLCLFMFYCI